MSFLTKQEFNQFSDSYLDTLGFCRGGNVWPSGTVWDCTPGSLTRADCAHACNTKSGCSAYDGHANVDFGECCLFSEGNTGNGDPGMTCSVQRSGIFVIKIAAH